MTATAHRHDAPGSYTRRTYRRAVSVGCLASARSMVTRVRYAVVIKEFRRVGAAHLMMLPIRETAIETVLNTIVDGPSRSEVLHVLGQVGAFIRFLRRNQEWVSGVCHG